MFLGELSIHCFKKKNLKFESVGVTKIVVRTTNEQVPIVRHEPIECFE